MPKINKSPKRPWIPERKRNDSKGWTSTGNEKYNSVRWRKLRQLVLLNSPICVSCKRKESKIADHIQPVRLGGDFWDLDNLQALCENCHNSKSAKEGNVT